MNCLLNLEREAINTAYEQYVLIVKSIKTYDNCLEKGVVQHSECAKLLKLEGVSTINAVNLYIALGCAKLGVFTKEKDVSACIGLTPMQYSSGDKTKLGSIGKYVKNSLVRSQLITGAMALWRYGGSQPGNQATRQPGGLFG